MGNLASLLTEKKELISQLNKMGVDLVIHGQEAIVATMMAQPTLLEEIKLRQMEDGALKKICDEIETKLKLGFTLTDSELKFQNRVCVPNELELKRKLMEEAHASRVSMHPRSTKMYRDLKQNFWWPSMKKEIAEFVSKCLQCQQVKAEHQIPAGLLQPLPIRERKW